MKTHNYIICMYDDHLKIVGPFKSTLHLNRWGERWQAANGDRPTWQSIYLRNPHNPYLVSVLPMGAEPV